MPVTEIHEGYGNFTINLKDDRQNGTPDDILDLITPFSAIVVTPVWQGPAGTISSANLLANAVWTGIYRNRGDKRTELVGDGPSVMLGDQDGKGVIYTAAAFTVTKTVANIVADNVIGSGRGNGITTNSLVTTNATTYTPQINPGDTPLKVLNFICDRATVEWRITPDLTLGVHTQGALYPTTATPTAIVHPTAGGRDLNISGFRANIEVETDWEDYTTDVTVKATTGALGTATLSPATPYYAPDGTLVEWRRFIDSNRATTTNAATAIAAAQLARFDDARHQIKVTVGHDVHDDINVGDTIYVYDPDNGLYDLTKEVYYRGQVMHPTTIRVFGMTWPVRHGMGVYLRASDSANTVYDLTPYVAWETGNVDLEVGATRRTMVAAS